MPRIYRDSDDESDSKAIARRKKTVVLPPVQNSPLRRSSRIKQNINPEISSPESVNDVALATNIKNSRLNRRRKLSSSSEASDLSELNGIDTKKRFSRRSKIPSPESPKVPKRSTRASSESKTSPSVGRFTRNTRAHSVGPDDSEEQIKTSIPGTPSRSRRRVSVLPLEPTVDEEVEDSNNRLTKPTNAKKSEGKSKTVKEVTDEPIAEKVENEELENENESKRRIMESVNSDKFSPDTFEISSESSTNSIEYIQTEDSSYHTDKKHLKPDSEDLLESLYSKKQEMHDLTSYEMSVGNNNKKNENSNLQSDSVIDGDDETSSVIVSERRKLLINSCVGNVKAEVQNKKNLSIRKSKTVNNPQIIHGNGDKLLKHNKSNIEKKTSKGKNIMEASVLLSKLDVDMYFKTIQSKQVVNVLTTSNDNDPKESDLIDVVQSKKKKHSHISKFNINPSEIVNISKETVDYDVVGDHLDSSEIVQFSKETTHCDVVVDDEDDAECSHLTESVDVSVITIHDSTYSSVDDINNSVVSDTSNNDKMLYMNKNVQSSTVTESFIKSCEIVLDEEESIVPSQCEPVNEMESKETQENDNKGSTNSPPQEYNEESRKNSTEEPFIDARRKSSDKKCLKKNEQNEEESVIEDFTQRTSIDKSACVDIQECEDESAGLPQRQSVGRKSHEGIVHSEEKSTDYPRRHSVGKKFRENVEENKDKSVDALQRESTGKKLYETENDGEDLISSSKRKSRGKKSLGKVESENESVDFSRRKSAGKSPYKEVGKDVEESIHSLRQKSVERESCEEIEVSEKLVDFPGRKSVRETPCEEVENDVEELTHSSQRKSVEREYCEEMDVSEESVDFSQRKSMEKSPRKRMDEDVEESRNLPQRKSIEKKSSENMEVSKESTDSQRKSIGKSPCKGMKENTEESENSPQRKSVEREFCEEMEVSKEAAVSPQRKSVEESPHRKIEDIELIRNEPQQISLNKSSYGEIDTSEEETVNSDKQMSLNSEVVKMDEEKDDNLVSEWKSESNPHSQETEVNEEISSDEHLNEIENKHKVASESSSQRASFSKSDGEEKSPVMSRRESLNSNHRKSKIFITEKIDSGKTNEKYSTLHQHNRNSVSSKEVSSKDRNSEDDTDTETMLLDLFEDMTAEEWNKRKNNNPIAQENISLEEKTESGTDLNLVLEEKEDDIDDNESVKEHQRRLSETSLETMQLSESDYSPEKRDTSRKSNGPVITNIEIISKDYIRDKPSMEKSLSPTKISTESDEGTNISRRSLVKESEETVLQSDNDNVINDNDEIGDDDIKQSSTKSQTENESTTPQKTENRSNNSSMDETTLSNKSLNKSTFSMENSVNVDESYNDVPEEVHTNMKNKRLTKMKKILDNVHEILSGRKSISQSPENSTNNLLDSNEFHEKSNATDEVVSRQPSTIKSEEFKARTKNSDSDEINDDDIINQENVSSNKNKSISKDSSKVQNAANESVTSRKSLELNTSKQYSVKRESLKSQSIPISNDSEEEFESDDFAEEEEEASTGRIELGKFVSPRKSMEKSSDASTVEITASDKISNKSVEFETKKGRRSSLLRIDTLESDGSNIDSSEEVQENVVQKSVENYKGKKGITALQKSTNESMHDDDFISETKKKRKSLNKSQEGVQKQSWKDESISLKDGESDVEVKECNPEVTDKSMISTLKSKKHSTILKKSLESEFNRKEEKKEASDTDQDFEGSETEQHITQNSNKLEQKNDAKTRKEQNAKFEKKKKNDISEQKKTQSTVVETSINLKGQKKMRESNKSSKAKFPKFLYSASSSDNDNESSSDIDSDVINEYNLAGETIQHYSDDDVLADECRASETRSEDSDDSGASMDSFINDETEEEELDVDEEVSDKSDREQDVESEESEEEKSCNKSAFLKKDNTKKNVNKSNVTFEIDADSLENEEVPLLQKVDESCVIVNENVKSKFKMQKQKLDLIKNSTPYTDKKVDGLSTKIRHCLDETVVLDDSAGQKNISLKEPKRRKSDSRKSLHRSLPTELKEASETANLSSSKAFKKSLLCQTLLNPSFETPVTKYLKKAKMNETEPIINLEDLTPVKTDLNLSKKKKKKESNEISVDQNIKKKNENFSQSLTEKKKSLVDKSVNEDFQQVNEEEQSKKKKKKKKKDHKMVESTERSTEDDKALIELKVPSPQTSEVENLGKKKKKKISTVSFQDEIKQEDTHKTKHEHEVPKKRKRTNVESVSSESVVIIDEDDEQKPRKKRSVDKSETRYVPNLINKPTKVNLHDYRKSASESANTVSDEIVQTKPSKEEKKRMKKQHLKKDKDEKIVCQQTSKTLKRLPEDLIENLTDIPRPQKRKKILEVEDEKVIRPSRPISEASGSHFNFNISFGNTLASSSGSTTSFDVISLQKAKKPPKPAQIVASYRQRMLSRNPRQPTSVFLMYQQKLRASGKNNRN